MQALHQHNSHAELLFFTCQGKKYNIHVIRTLWWLFTAVSLFFKFRLISNAKNTWLLLEKYFCSFFFQVSSQHSVVLHINGKNRSESISGLSFPASHLCHSSSSAPVSSALQNPFSSEPKTRDRKRPDRQTRRRSEVQDIWNWTDVNYSSPKKNVACPFMIMKRKKYVPLSEKI